MKRLRQDLRSRKGAYRRAALLAAVAAVCGAAVQPASAAPHAHARRALPTRLHGTAIETTGAHGSSAHAKAGAHTATGKKHAAEPVESKAGKKGARHKAVPADDAPPLLRAHAGAVHGHTALRRAADRADVSHEGSRRHGVHGADRRSLQTFAALRDARHTSLAPVAVRAAAPSRYAAVRVPAARAVIATDNDRGDHYVPRHTTASAAPSRAFAEGVARPDEDERLPLVQGPATTSARGTELQATHGAEIPLTDRVSAAPSTTGAPRGSRVVQGFGGELAMAPSDGGVRPGGTRRRGHPATYVPQSMVSQPEALEEREEITSAAVSPTVLPLSYDRDGRLVMPAPMRGSRLILAHQNQMATSDGLERIQDDADLDRLRAAHLLISFPTTDALHVNEELSWNRRCARPWAVAFANDMAQAYFMHFHQPLTVTSAVRTVRYQARLQMVNGNAAATSGDLASPHLTGQAIDFAKRGMSTAELAWMRGYLLPLMQAGKIDVEEEFQQACFHVSIYRSYLAGRHVAPSRALAQAREIGSGNSAAANPASVAVPLESGLPPTSVTALPPLDH